tara:strand:+ start:63 stop:1139 length:1077 start_codon:yes stop_codon:yes gene_type:complete
MYYDICFSEINIDVSNYSNIYSFLLDISNNRDTMTWLLDMSTNQFFSALYDNSNINTPTRNFQTRYLFIPINDRENFYTNSTGNNLSSLSNELNNISNEIPFNGWSQNRINNYVNENDNLNVIYRNLFEQSFQAKNKYKKIAPDQVINDLKKIKFKSNDEYFKNTSCPIYYTDFEDGEEITILPCNHCFNNIAIKKWLSEESNECPVCRYEFSYNEIKIDTKNNDNNSSQNLDEQRNLNSQINLETNIQTNLNYNLQQMINRIYSTNHNSNIRSNLFDYINYNEDNSEEEINGDDVNGEDVNEEDISRNLETTIENSARNIYLSRLRSNFYRQIQNVYQEEIYNRDLEEAISRSLQEQ